MEHENIHLFVHPLLPECAKSQHRCAAQLLINHPHPCSFFCTHHLRKNIKCSPIKLYLLIYGPEIVVVQVIYFIRPLNKDK